MTYLSQLTKSEEVFQEWIKKSETLAKGATGSSKQFRRIRDPYDADDKYPCFDFLEKITIRVSPQFYDTPDEFMPLVIDYLIDNAVLVYDDSLRIAACNHSVVFHKDCGDQLGAVVCFLEREGYCITAALGYNIFHLSQSIKMSSSALQPCNNTTMRNTLAFKSYRASRFFKTKRFIGFVLMTAVFSLLILGLIACASLIARGFFEQIKIAAGFLGFLFGGYVFYSFNRFVDGEVASEHRALVWESNQRLTNDLSPIHFPVMYLDQEGVVKGIAANQDHQVFIQRIRGILQRSVALAEQVHNVSQAGDRDPR